MYRPDVTDVPLQLVTWLPGKIGLFVGEMRLAQLLAASSEIFVSISLRLCAGSVLITHSPADRSYKEMQRRERHLRLSPKLEKSMPRSHRRCGGFLCSDFCGRNIGRELVRVRWAGASSLLLPEGRVQVLRNCNMQRGIGEGQISGRLTNPTYKIHVYSRGKKYCNMVLLMVDFACF